MDNEKMYPLCPLNPQMFRSEQPMGLKHLKEIEEHVKSNCTDCPHLPLKYLVFHNNSPIKGSTPLLMACYYGELASVKYIVESWGVDANLGAAYYFDPFHNVFNDNSIFIKIEKATPLFVAANMGHLDIVQYLVDHAGADVSAKTANEANADYDGLTPLYGAVTHYRKKPPAEERSAIVRYLLESGADPSIDAIRPSDGNPMWARGLCNIDAITSLIEHGMKVNQRYPNLDLITLLNYSIVYQSLEVVELLVKNGADLHIQDSWGLTPIIRAACQLNWDVFDFLFEKNDLIRVEKIEALELAGATILRFHGNEPYFISKAIGYWRRSLHLRSMNTDGYGAIIKTPPKNPENGLLVEWVTLEDLEDVIQHHYKLEIQSFLIQSRIFSAKSWKILKAFYEEYISESIFGSQLVKQGRFAEVLSIFWSMLETIRDDFDANENKEITTLEVLKCISFVFCKLERDDPFLNENTIEKSLELILTTGQFHWNDRRGNTHAINLYYKDYMDSMFNLIVKLAELPHLINVNAMESLRELVRESRPNPYFGRKSLLHMVCENHLNIQHLAIPTVRLLLRAGADSNAGHLNGNGVFHTLVIESRKCKKPRDMVRASVQESVARLLLDAGAHLDRVNDERKTAAVLWMDPLRRINSRGKFIKVEPQKSDMPSWLRDDSVPKLQCQCVKVICSNGVPYKHLLPPSLHPFVSWH